MTTKSNSIHEETNADAVLDDNGTTTGPLTGRKKKAASAFRTISEVASELEVQQHVLRFWETKFSQVRPLKRGGGRRYYRPEDIALLQSIRHLLYTEGYTIKGVQKMLREQGKKAVSQAMALSEQAVRTAQSPTAEANVSSEKANKSQKDEDLSRDQKAALQTMLDDLKALRSMIKTD